MAIRIENYCEVPVPIDGDAPKTSKSDKRNHGYGIKSIRRTVSKYGGHVKIAQEGNWFILTALIPEKQDK